MSATELPPIPQSYTRTIAERSFFLRSHAGECDVRVEFGEPIQDVAVTNGTDWRCPLRLTVGTQVSVRSIIGIDSLQALRLATEHARVELEIIATRPGAALFYLEQAIDTSQPGWQKILV